VDDGTRGTETILMVEDDEAVRDLMQRALRARGYTVLDAPTTAEAIATAQRYDAPIDLLVSDVVMPGLNGPDLAQRIIQFRPQIGLLYVSGFTNNLPIRSDSISSRAAFLPKPFTAQVLASRVRECLDTLRNSTLAAE
jgi:DNA-binding NtrC family response regulator